MGKSYVTFTLQEKIDLLKQLERRQTVGKIKSHRSGGNVQDDFDTANLNPDQEILDLKRAIYNDPAFTSDHPLYAAIAATFRASRRIVTVYP